MLKIHAQILEVFKRHPKGISINALRLELGLSSDEQQHLDRRVRALDRSYAIDRVRAGREILYVLRGKRKEVSTEPGISKTLRARILHLAGYRCQMCGRTVAEDGVKLHVDHKIPLDWGGKTEEDNLWALCAECNEGKKNFFASITDPRIRQAMLHKSVHIRIGELLKAFEGQWIPKTYIQIIAYTHDDFEKRLRELRELGWSYQTMRRREGRRVRTYFKLDRWESWPPDPAAAIREAEAAKRSKR